MSDAAVADATTQAATTTTQAAATTTVSEPWYKDFISSDGSLNHKALERLPDHLKPLKETWSRQKTIDDLGTSTVHFQSLAAKKALAPLTGTEPKEVIAERKAHLDALNGVPKEAKEYGITRENIAKELPENLWDQKLADGFAKWAHDNSVSPAAVKKLLNEVQLPQIRANIEAQKAYEAQYWAKEQKAFEAAIQRDNIPMDKAAALVEKGAIALGLDLSNPDVQTLLKGSIGRQMALKHAIGVAGDVTITGSEPTRAEQNPGDLANDAVRNPANPLNGPYWNKEGKYSRQAHDSAVEQVNQWRRLAAERGVKITDRRT